MSIMIDLPPVMAQEVKEYVTVRGTTLEQLFLDYLKTELKRWHEVDAVMSKLDALAKKTSARLTGEACIALLGAFALGANAAPSPLASGTVVVTPCVEYNSWPMIQSVGGKLVCAYSRGSAHTIGEGRRGVFARTSSDGGCTWSDEKCVVNDPEVGEVTIGKGLDANGDMLLWVRNWGKTRRHDLYRTSDGVAFERISSPRLDPMPIQITDVFYVPGTGLMSLWFAGDYRKGEGNSWGTLTSEDNGRTWTQRTVERGLPKMEWPTEQSAVCLGDGRILAVARTERGGKCQFQLTSTDCGRTWCRRRTNISDVLESTPSLIYSPKTGLVSNYYYQRGARKLKCRVARAESVFLNPEAWPEPEVLAEGMEERDYDAGNVNATSSGAVHYLAFYTGSTSNTEVRVVRARR